MSGRTPTPGGRPPQSYNDLHHYPSSPQAAGGKIADYCDGSFAMTGSHHDIQNSFNVTRNKSKSQSARTQCPAGGYFEVQLDEVRSSQPRCLERRHAMVLLRREAPILAKLSRRTTLQYTGERRRHDARSTFNWYSRRRRHMRRRRPYHGPASYLTIDQTVLMTQRCANRP